jgi:uncharacterized protein YcfL
MKNTLLSLAAFVLIGCASTPEVDRRAVIEQDYKAGKLTTAEYHGLINQLDSLEHQEKANKIGVYNSLNQ